VSAERSQRFFGELAELQHAARLLPAADAGASFFFDVSFPGVRAPPAEVTVLVGPSDTVRRVTPASRAQTRCARADRRGVQGSVCTVGVQPQAEGVDRVREVISAKKAAHFHCALTRHLRCAALLSLCLLLAC